MCTTVQGQEGAMGRGLGSPLCWNWIVYEGEEAGEGAQV